ncbi:LIM and SH3 domain protein Lasp [Rhagoletis pomonella]|uniref:LIM and SH3 domain protein Lasp n=1 Tax=Rhagoletis pomonella TaxID=28610 RepID=UPI00177C7984|nr:LIM and SH3 domain protein Lasp [Rhagoletis pomonella]
MNKTCARCQKVVYPIEELKCLDKNMKLGEIADHDHFRNSCRLCIGSWKLVINLYVYKRDNRCARVSFLAMFPYDSQMNQQENYKFKRE